MVKFLSVSSTADSVAHTCTISSPSATLNVDGTFTITSAQSEEMFKLYTPNFIDQPSLSITVTVVSAFPIITSRDDDVASSTVKVRSPSNALLSDTVMSIHLVELLADANVKTSVDTTLV